MKSQSSVKRTGRKPSKGLLATMRAKKTASTKARIKAKAKGARKVATTTKKTTAPKIVTTKINVTRGEGRTAALYAYVKPVNMTWVQEEAAKVKMSASNFVDQIIEQVRNQSKT